jgi:hypothetical protein
MRTPKIPLDIALYRGMSWVFCVVFSFCERSSVSKSFSRNKDAKRSKGIVRRRGREKELFQGVPKLGSPI